MKWWLGLEEGDPGGTAAGVCQILGVAGRGSKRVTTAATLLAMSGEGSPLALLLRNR